MKATGVKTRNGSALHAMQRTSRASDRVGRRKGQLGGRDGCPASAFPSEETELMQGTDVGEMGLRWGAVLAEAAVCVPQQLRLSRKGTAFVQAGGLAPLVGGGVWMGC